MNPLSRASAPFLLALLCATPLAGLAQPAPSTSAAEAPASTERKNGLGETLSAPRRGAAKSAGVMANRPYAPIRKVDDEGQVAEIEMFVGESRVFPTPGVARIAVGNGSLLTASALDGKEVILFANGVGTSSLFIWNADGRYQRVKISIVPGDTSRHAREIAAFLSTIPKARASIVGANIIVEGDELSDADILKIEELAKRYPQIVNFTNRVGWEQMVMMDVKVAEFPVNVLRDIGLKWSSTGGAALAGIWSLGRRGHSGPYEVQIRTGQDNAVPITGPDGAAAPIPNGLNAIGFMNLGLNAQLNLLAQEGKATLLAEPQLSARSGSKASFVAGGEIPYAISTRDGVYVQFKTYGVKLDITPRVDKKGVIRATVQTEVSSVDRSVSTVAGPALLSRRTETEFNLRDGETIVLSGLLQRDASSDVDKVPLLGDLPVLGALFRSKRFHNKETELVVFVTPRVVTAQSPDMVDRVQRSRERLEERLGPSPHLSEPLQPGVRDEPAASAPAADSPAAESVHASPVPAARTPAADPRAEGGSTLTVVAAGTALRAQPDAHSAMLMALDGGVTVLLGRADAQPPGVGSWLNVVVGSLDGWVPAAAVQPRSRAARQSADAAAAQEARSGQPAPRPLVPGSAPAPTPRAVTASRAASQAIARRYRVDLDGLALRATPDINADVIVQLLAGDTVRALPQTPRGAWTAVEWGDDAQARRGWVATQWLVPLPTP